MTVTEISLSYKKNQFQTGGTGMHKQALSKTGQVKKGKWVYAEFKGKRCKESDRQPKRA